MPRKSKKEEIPEESSEEVEYSEEESSEEPEEESPEEVEEPEEESSEEVVVVKKKAPVKKAPTKKAAAKKATTGGKRSFKLLVDQITPVDKSPKVDDEKVSSNGGRYTGNNPMQAGKKAFTRLCSAIGKGKECSYIFSIQETTKGSAKKVFTYIGARAKLDEPQEIQKGDTSYFISYNSTVKAYREEKPKPVPKKEAKSTPSKKRVTSSKPASKPKAKPKSKAKKRS